MLILGYIFAAIVGAGLMYGVNEVFLDDDDDTAVPEDEGVDDGVARDGAIQVDTADGAQLIEDFVAGESQVDLTTTADARIGVGNSPADNAAFLSLDGAPLVEFSGVEDLSGEDIDVVLPGNAETGLLANRLGLVVQGADPVILDDAEASSYVVGTEGADSVTVTDGMAIANLEGGDDVFINTDEAATATLTLEGRTADGGAVADAGSNMVQRVYGGAGDDQISGGVAGGFLFGDVGDDLINTGSGAAIADGGAGNDTLVAGTVAGEAADPQVWLIGGAGDDQATGGDGADLIWGDDVNGADGGGSDTLDGGLGNDILRGGTGADALTGGAGNDILDGYGNADLTRDDVGSSFAWRSDGAADTLDAGAGDDGVLADRYDTVTLGEGADLLAVAHDTTVDPLEGGAVAVVVTDFEVGVDALNILLDPSQLPDGAVAETAVAFELALAEGELDTLVLVDGVTVAILQGVTNADPDDITVAAAAPDVAAGDAPAEGADPVVEDEAEAPVVEGEGEAAPAEGGNGEDAPAEGDAPADPAAEDVAAN